MYRVVVTDSDFPPDRLEANVLGDEFEVMYAQARRADEVIAAAQGAQGLLVQWASIDATVIRSLSELRAVVRFGVGLDNIDLDAAASSGIAVANIPDYCIDEVASHACAMIVADSRRLGAYDAAVKRGEWSQRRVGPPAPPSDDPVGIAGFGRIGQALAVKLIALGHPVHVSDPFMPNTDLPVVRMRDLVELADAVNHLSLHMPAGKDTVGSCGADVLAALGPDGHLVNTSRGTLVDELALLKALESDGIRWASLDVLSMEPPLSDAALALARHPRVTCTPHVSYLSTKSETKLRRFAAKRLGALLRAE